MSREKLICDKRSGCVAIYKSSDKDETNGCHSDDKRNIAFSSKDSNYAKGFWNMCEDTQTIYEEIVNAYNEKYNL